MWSWGGYQSCFMHHGARWALHSSQQGGGLSRWRGMRLCLEVVECGSCRGCFLFGHVPLWFQVCAFECMPVMTHVNDATSMYMILKRT